MWRGRGQSWCGCGWNSVKHPRDAATDELQQHQNGREKTEDTSLRTYLQAVLEGVGDHGVVGQEA